MFYLTKARVFKEIGCELIGLLIFGAYFLQTVAVSLGRRAAEGSGLERFHALVRGIFQLTVIIACLA